MTIKVIDTLLRVNLQRIGKCVSSITGCKRLYTVVENLNLLKKYYACGTEETCLQDCLVILKRMLQNY